MADTIPKLRTLEEFLEALESERGLHRKVRLLGHYWRQVRELSDDDRQRVALALGSQAAWNRLERLFNSDGRLSEGERAVKTALKRVGRADPAELRKIAGQLRDGEYEEVGSELLDAMGQALEEEAGIEEEEPAEPDADEPDGGARASETSGADQGEGVAEPDDSAPGVGDETAVAEDEEVADEQAAGVAPEHQETEPDATQEPEDTPEVGAVAVTAPAGSPTEKPVATDYGDTLSRMAGWRARRDLGERIRSGQITDVADVLELTEHLESDTLRTWILSDLVEHMTLDRDELETVLAAAPSAAVQRRLRARHERAS